MPRGRFVDFLHWQDEVTGAASIRWALQLNFLPHGRRWVDSSLEARLCRSGSAVRHFSGPCVEFPSAALALRRSSRCKVKLCCSGLTCGEIFTTVQAVRRFWQASCKDEVFLVLRLQGTGDKLYPSPWRALLHHTQRAAGQQQGSSPSQKADM
ncbi:hypothetical protein NDU88_001826 [Pleurodeles waltl]|uniref:Uncharacterized protein n=1 Tax=Pleurodeles waltl TaxID=8319 RepID=A0AAV7RC07_PLEWA|nr:hypothetical protein NDU88_001826 [Pleurodeles waltl]